MVHYLHFIGPGIIVVAAAAYVTFRIGYDLGRLHAVRKGAAEQGPCRLHRGCSAMAPEALKRVNGYRHLEEEVDPAGQVIRR
jgi:hypothetical protein